MTKKYKSSFLKRVILRLDFEKIELGNLEDFFGKDLKKIFPKTKIQKKQEGTIQLNFESGQVAQMRNQFNVFSFENASGTKKMEISEKYAFIEYNKYESFKKLETDANKIINNFIEIFKIQTINRLGLRYINEIELKDGNPLEWNDYINRSLLGGLSFSKNNKSRIARAMSQIIFKQEKGDLTFNYGIFNKEFPNEIVTKEFILDFDCSSLFPFETKNDEVMIRIREYHSYIKKLFNASVRIKK